ncbi:MAG: shikimate dehydrogenase family protein [Thermodesulfobacteriota bacterium]
MSDFNSGAQAAPDKTELFTAILGESPSRGAKSPSLWNAAFEELGLPGSMLAIDVPPTRLGEVVEGLRSDKRFIGGSVTMPYKIDIMPYLDEVDHEAGIIGAVNCLYRDGDRLCGANTDGAGAMWGLEKRVGGPLRGRCALMVGTGGAGFAVAFSLAEALGKDGTLLLANRTPGPAQGLAKRLASLCRAEVIAWPVTAGDAARASLLANCTSVGFETMKKDAGGAFSLRPYTALGPLDYKLRVPEGPDALPDYFAQASRAIGDNIAWSMRVLAAMDHPLVFDVIYQPKVTMLLHLAEILGYPTLNGVSMNLEQAVIAFDKATVAAGLRPPDTDSVRVIMTKVWHQESITASCRAV